MDSAADLLREARARSGLSLAALARRAGVPTSTVSRIESGQHDATWGTLSKLLAAADFKLEAGLTSLERPSIADLSDAVSLAGGRVTPDWTRLRAFVDWASAHPEQLPAALKAAPAAKSDVLAALLASLAELLCHQAAVAAPAWTADVGPLEQPWSSPMTPAMRARAAAATPPEFRRRNLIVARESFLRNGPADPAVAVKEPPADQGVRRRGAKRRAAR